MMSGLPQSPDSFTPTLHLIYANRDLRASEHARIISRIGVFNFLGKPKPVLEWQIQSADKILGNLRFDGHHIKIAGLSAPLPPEVIDRTINVSLWQAQIKAGMRGHQSQLSLVYGGGSPDPIERMLALYQAAHAFKDENLLGVVNEPAWTAHPTADFLTIEKIRGYQQEIPFILWFGYVRVFVDKQRYWLVTKGHHLFDVPDLACFNNSLEEEEGAINNFVNLFCYLYEKDVRVTAGDTLEIGNTGDVLQFLEVKEFTETLMGPAGTLVIEKKEQRNGNNQDPSG